MQPALLVTPTLVTARTSHLLTLLIKGTVEGQVLLRQSDESSSEEPRLEKAKAPSPILVKTLHRDEPAPMSFSEKPANNHESEGNAYTRSGRQVKPVRKDGMYYY